MPFDGIFMSNICRELNSAVGSRVEKIYQPSKDEIVLLLSTKGFSKKLYVSAGGIAPRVHFTSLSFENPSTPPMFCMLMRKYFIGAKLISVSQYGLDRVLTFTFSAYNEMGDLVELCLIAEIMGRQSNIIITCNNKIIDALKRSDIESSKRLILSGANYVYPESQGKADIRDLTDISPRIESYTASYEGVSPLISREIEHYFSIGRPNSILSLIKSSISNGKPYILIKDSNAFDYTYIPILQYGNSTDCKEFDSFSALLDSFYEKRQKQDEIRRRTYEVNKLTDTLIERVSRRIEKQKGDLARCENPDELRVFGELIKANIHMIERGASVAEVPNYYDEEYKNTRIKLNPELTPAQNAQKYFKDYKKAITAGEMLKKLIKAGEDELQYLFSVKDELSRAQCEKELTEIKLELESAGYIRINSKQKRLPKALPPLTFKSTDGFIIRVGRNNRQNDELTTKLSQKSDLWLHTKAIHGAHVIISTDAKDVPDSTVLQAAMLAAYHSNARQSSSVAVDYCTVKNVKKPSGAKPGMVIYDNYNTLYVTPDEQLIDKLKF